MARIRTIKPEFFTSEDIVSLSPLARLLYIALWCESDKEGRLTWKPKTFKMRYLPGDKCDIDALCNELVSVGVVVLYGEGLAHIPCFTKHQHVNPRESKSDLPEPPTHVERLPAKIPTDVRDLVFARDGGKCVRCGSDDHPQLDHILPQSCGGPHIAENLRVLCRSCNAGRPVSGEGLDKDLEKDGHTLNSLRSKFGIDASNLDLHAQGGREGKGRERKGKEPASSRGGRFEDFWNAWPKSERKQDRKACSEKWIRDDLDSLIDTILADIAVKRQTEKWRGGFIEAPEVYLNNRRWEDGVTPASGDEPAMVDPNSRGYVEALGMSRGMGKWDELKERWDVYAKRVKGVPA